MNAKTKKLALIGAAAVVLCAGIFMALQAFNENLVFFFSPTQVAAKEAPVGRTFRLGGVVEKNSVVHFRITDTAQTVNVEYKGILPDLFAEEQGVVAQGKLNEAGVFVASEVLAKHDENYMPPEAAKALEDAQIGRSDAGQPSVRIKGHYSSRCEAALCRLTRNNGKERTAQRLHQRRTP